MKKFREILSSGDKGFTLIELLVVIAVLGILAGIAVPRLSGVTDKAESAAIKSIAGSIKTGMEIYAVENGGNYPQIPQGEGTRWEDLQATIDTIKDEDKGDYNIASITYSSNGTDQYLITFTGTDNTGPATFYLGEKGFSETQSEASDQS